MFESLELRRMLANYTWNDAANTLAISLGNNESLSVAETSGSVSFTLSAGTFTQSGGNAAPGSGTATITLAAADLVSSVTINNSTVTGGTNNVTFSGAGSLSSAAIAVNITDADATGTISTTGGFDLTSTGVGGIKLETSRNVDLNSGTVISSTSGNIALRANQQQLSTAGDYIGIDIDNTVISSGIGEISLEGRGGTGKDNNIGVRLLNNAKLSSPSGAIEVIGTGGGDGTGSGNYGVNLQSGVVVELTGEPIGPTILINGFGGKGTDFNGGLVVIASSVTSINGPVRLFGTGGAGTGIANYGIDMNAGTVAKSTGTSNLGTVTLGGTGGTGTNFNSGVRLSNVTVSSESSTIDLTGKGGNGSGFSNYGIDIDNRAAVDSTEDSVLTAITIEGTGGTGTDFNIGVRLSAGKVSSLDGNIAISGAGGGSGADDNNYGISIEQGSTVEADGAQISLDARGNLNSRLGIRFLEDSQVVSPGGFVDVVANTAEIGAQATIGGDAVSVILGTSATDGTVGIDIGGADSSMALGLSDTELDRITAGKIVIGDAATPNTIQVTAAIQHAGDANFEVLSARNISLQPDSSWTTTAGDLTFLANLGSTATGGYFSGVSVGQGATMTTNGTGNILLQGRGGDLNAIDHGVYVTGTVQSTSAAANAGTITLLGTGGLGNTEKTNPGVRVASGLVTSVRGDIHLTGTGGGRDQFSGDNFGVLIDVGGTVSSTGVGADAAKIFIDGTGGIGGGGNFGVLVDTDGRVSSKDGDIQITATAGQNTLVAFATDNRAVIQSTGTADVAIISDADAISDLTSINAATSTVTLKTKTTNGAIRIDIGGADNSFTLGLTDAELDRITAGTIIIGDADTQNVVSVVAAIQHAGDDNFEVLSGREIGINAPLGSWTSVAGDLTFRANQGATASPGNFIGVTVNGGFIKSTSGDITLAGRGGNGGSSSLGRRQYGVIVQNGGVVGQTSGNVTLNGTGVGAGGTSENHGVYIVDAGSEVSAVNLGTVTIFGQAGTAFIGSSYGVFVDTGSQILSGGGAVKVTGIGAISGEAIAVTGGGKIISGGTADLTLIADSIAIGSSATISAGFSAGKATIKTRTAGTLINLGGPDVLTGRSLTLGLTDAELGHVFARTLIIGANDSGKIEVTSDIKRVPPSEVQLISGDDVVFRSGQVNTSGGTLLLHPGDSPAAVKPIKSGVDATASTVSFASDLAIAINGATVDTGYNQLNVVGTVDLTGVDLVLSGSYVPQGGNKFTIVSATSVVGTFNGLPDGSKVTVNGVELTLRYTATTVVLSAGRGPEDVIALGAEAGAKPRVKVIDSQTGEVIVSFLAYSSSFRGGVRVAVADMNGDGTAEIIVAPGAGMSTQVRVFDLDAHELTDFRTTAYAGFAGGVFVAAGDVNGDGRVDLITTPGAGMSSQVKVFKNRVGIVSTNPDPLSNSPIYTFNAFGSTFKGGATVAAGDVTGDGRADIVVGNGPGMSPHVRVFDTSLIDPPPPTGKITLGPYLYQITPFNSTDRGGVFVAVGDVRGDSRAEIIIGNGVNGRSRVEMYNPDGLRFKSFTAYTSGQNQSSPVHVAAKSVDLDSYDELLTGQGTPSSGLLNSFNSDGTLNDSVFEGDSDFRFGFFVA